MDDAMHGTMEAVEQGPLAQALYAGAKALKDTKNEADGATLRELARLLHDSRIDDIATLGEIVQV